uniref:Leukocyte antigen CD37-like isoform X2 n=1 Tax=Geotrypetes seraphini TaxID=260995 RepID=A0A6P8SQ91_GEOSA|nr:leukocyte antigen CD37-like isoform X2 [Geotrypetes seraphini]
MCHDPVQLCKTTQSMRSVVFAWLHLWDTQSWRGGARAETAKTLLLCSGRKRETQWLYWRLSGESLCWTSSMATKGCLGVTKYFLFVFNLFFFVLGGLLFSFGLWILFDRTCIISLLGASLALKIWSYVFSGVGIFTMLLGFLGCLGALKEIKCLLGFYFGFLLLLFAAQITVGVLVYTQKNTLKSMVGVQVKEIISHYGSGSQLSDKEESWDFVQTKFQCCGWISSTDWKENQRVSNSSGFLYSCSCLNTSLPVPAGRNSSASNNSSVEQLLSGFCAVPEKDSWPVYHRGCVISIQTWISGNIFTILGVCLGIGLLELFVMTLSMCLCRNLDQDYNKLSRYS